MSACLRCGHRLPESIPTLLGLEHVCTACRDAERQAQLLTRLNENLESSQEAAARARENARDDNERIFRALEDDRQEREQAAEDQLERMEEMQEDFLEQQQENIANRWRLEAQSRADQAHAHFRANRYREAMRLAQQAYADDPGNMRACAVAGWAAARLGDDKAHRSSLESQISLLRMAPSSPDACRIAKEIRDASFGRALQSAFSDAIHANAAVVADVLDTLLKDGHTEIHEAARLLEASTRACRDSRRTVWRLTPFEYELALRGGGQKMSQIELTGRFVPAAFTKKCAEDWSSILQRASLSETTKISVCRAAIDAHALAGLRMDDFLWAAIPYSIEIERRLSFQPRFKDLEVFANAIRQPFATAEQRHKILDRFARWPWDLARAARKDLSNVVLSEYRLLKEKISEEAHAHESKNNSWPIAIFFLLHISIIGAIILTVPSRFFFHTISVVIGTALAGGLLVILGEELFRRAESVREYLVAERGHLSKALSVSSSELDSVLPIRKRFPSTLYAASALLLVFGVLRFGVLPQMPTPPRDYWWFKVVRAIPGGRAWQEAVARIDPSLAAALSSKKEVAAKE